MSRTLVLGDVHGAFRALEQVFDRAAFDPARDRLISLGDLCDRWPEVDRCFDLLLEVEDLTVVLGNHDEWAAEWMLRGRLYPFWFDNGGDTTVASYLRRFDRDAPETADEVRALADDVPAEHAELLRRMVPYHIEDGPDTRRLFTHAGWDPGRPPDEQTGRDLRMDRSLWYRARRVAAGLEETPEGGWLTALTGFDEVYLGHTPTEWPEPRPVLEIWNLDQGAGWDGRLTLLEVDTKEHWQSDPVPELYG